MTHLGTPLPRGWRMWGAAFGLWLSFGPAARAQTADAGWVLRHEDTDTGTQIFLRKRGDDMPEFRAVTRMPVRLSALAAVLMDVDRMKDWVYRTRRVVRIETRSSTEGIAQVVTGLLWPLDDREAVVAWRLQQDAAGVVTIDGRSAPEKLPPTPRLQRMPSFQSQWRFAPLPDGQVEVRFEGHGDPGGNLGRPPLSYIMKAVVWQAPLETLNGLRRVVQQPRYRDAVLPFVREPAR